MGLEDLWRPVATKTFRPLWVLGLVLVPEVSFSMLRKENILRKERERESQLKLPLNPNLETPKTAMEEKIPFRKVSFFLQPWCANIYVIHISEQFITTSAEESPQMVVKSKVIPSQMAETIRLRIYNKLSRYLCSITCRLLQNQNPSQVAWATSARSATTPFAGGFKGCLGGSEGIMGKGDGTDYPKWMFPKMVVPPNDAFS